MIKTDAQLKQAQEQQKALLAEEAEILAQYGAPAPNYLLSQTLEQRQKIEAEIEEYQKLKNLSLDEAVKFLAQHPVLIENIGELLAKLRIAAGLTQEQLAHKLGWEQSNVSRFESASYSSQTIGKVAEYLDAVGVWLHIVPSKSERLQRFQVTWSSVLSPRVSSTTMSSDTLSENVYAAEPLQSTLVSTERRDRDTEDPFGTFTQATGVKLRRIASSPITITDLPGTSTLVDVEAS